MEGVCFIDINEDSLAFAILTLKGMLAIYRVKNTGESGVTMIDSCYLDWSTSIQDVIRQRVAASNSALIQEESGNQSIAKITVKSIKLVSEGCVLLFLSDNTVFEYEQKIKLWR